MILKGRGSSEDRRFATAGSPRLLWSVQDVLVLATVALAFHNAWFFHLNMEEVAAVWLSLCVFALLRPKDWSYAADSLLVRFVRLETSWAFAASASLAIPMDPRLGSLIVLATCGLALFVYRELELLIFRTWRRYFRAPKAAAILGATEQGLAMKRSLEETDTGYKVVGIYDDRGPNRRAEVKTDGSFSQAIEDARSGSFDIAFVCLPLRAQKRVNEIIDALSETLVEVRYVSNISAVSLLFGASWDKLDRMLIIRPAEPLTWSDRVVKRAFDLCFATIILMIIAIPLVVIGILVKLTSKGPVLFRQTRYGLHGRAIRVWKFRTMTVVDEGQLVTQAATLDVRIPEFGRFLRRTALDELPMFFSVLSGELSVVGPQLTALAHNERYSGQIPGYVLRHKVKPGLTGLAQIRGYRSLTDDDMAARVECDLEYIENWSIWLDLRIVLVTLFGRRPDANAPIKRPP